MVNNTNVLNMLVWYTKDYWILHILSLFGIKLKIKFATL